MNNRMENMIETQISENVFLKNDFEFAHKQDKPVFSVSEVESERKRKVRLFMKNKGAVAALAGLMMIILLAVFGPFISGYTYEEQIIQNQNLAPRIPVLENIGIFDGSERTVVAGEQMTVNKYEDIREDRGEDIYYWFGSDSLGRDLFTRTWIGTRISLYVALTAVLVDLCVGMLYGMISGYFGGKTDFIMQRFCEILSGIPTLVIVTLLMLVFEPGLMTITIALAVTGWVGMSKIARAQVLKLKEQEFVLASKTLGAGSVRVMFKEILPNIFGQLLTAIMLSIPNAIFTESFLAFVGLGVPAPMASLGTLISDGFKSFTMHPYMIMAPVIVLACIMLCFNIVADGLRDVLEPTER